MSDEFTRAWRRRSEQAEERLAQECALRALAEQERDEAGNAARAIIRDALLLKEQYEEALLEIIGIAKAALDERRP